MPRPTSGGQCTITAGQPQPNVSIAIGQRPEQSNAPVPRTSSERLVFRQLYETLVGLDCNGAVIPLLAESWEAGEGGLVWRFRLRNDVRFWDGSAVTARDIAESWAVRSDSILPIEGITVTGARELRVALRTPVRGVERFADPALAVARYSAGGWPLGTGRYRPDPRADARTLRIVGSDTMTVPRSIEFRSGSDPRAALDGGVDAVVTADPAAIEYARALRNYTATPIGWTRTYVLASRGAQRTDSLSTSVPDAEIERIREVLRAETRVADAPFSWQREECARSFAPVRTDTRNRNVVYPSNDPVARSIAERLVALAWPAGRAPAWLRAQLGDYSALGAPAALGVDQRTLLETVRTGRALAVVTALPRSAGAACTSATDVSTALLAGWRVTALLDAREYLVHRGSLGRVVLEGDGAIRFGR